MGVGECKLSQSLSIRRSTGQWITREENPLPIYSLTKTFIAACVFAAEIPIKATIDNWISQDLVPRAGDITLSQLLNHTSGIRDYGALPEYTAAIRAGKPWTDEDFATHTLAKGLLFEPGTQYAYANPGYWLVKEILQLHTGLDFADCIARFVTTPLGLKNTSVVTGVFSSELPDYPADWVWHGLLMSSSSDVVQFLDSPLVEPLRVPGDLVRVPVDHPHWTNPSSAYGLMVDPGIRYGHTGDGPGFSAAGFVFLPQGVTACLLCSTDVPGAALDRLLPELPS